MLRTTPSVAARTRRAWLPAALLFAAGMALMFRYSWLPGPKRSIGDNGDGEILVATLEHWFRAFSGQDVAWLSPEWFWPAKNVLGQTDTYFLFALPYSLMRMATIGPFDAYTATIATLAVSGFWGFVLLCRAAGVRPTVAAVFAFVFAFGTLPTFKIGHGQTYAAMLVPWFGVLLISFWRATWPVRRWAALAGAGLLYGLLALTAPQTAWFLGFEAALAMLVVAALTRRQAPAWLRAHLPQLAHAILVGAAGLALGLVPVILVYAQTVAKQRDWAAPKYYMARLSDILNVQDGNWLWYDLLHRIGIADAEGRPAAEVTLGFTPGLAVCGMAALLLLGRLRRLAGSHPWDVPARAFLAVAFIGWLLTSRYGGVRPWYLVYTLVPGAAGIRTPFRIQLISSFFLCLGLAHVASRTLAVASSRGLTKLSASVGALLALNVIEQLGSAPTTRNTGEMMRWLSASHRPDFPCEAFYVLPPPADRREAWYEYQSDAMLLSQWIAMPTINGNSSWYPDGWEMLFPDKPEYAGQALAWIDRNGLRGRVCGADPRSGHWVDGIEPLLAAAHRS